MTLLTAQKKEDCLCDNCIHIKFCEFKTIKIMMENMLDIVHNA